MCYAGVKYFLTNLGVFKYFVLNLQLEICTRSDECYHKSSLLHDRNYYSYLVEATLPIDRVGIELQIIFAFCAIE